MHLREAERYRIVAPCNVPALTFAAEELARYLEAILGQPLEIVAGDMDAIAIALVQTDDTMPSGFPDSPAAGDRESYVIESRDLSVTFVGNRPRAVLYAVYDFLRRECGCEFALSVDGIEHVPHLAELALSPMHRREVADFATRGNGFHGEAPRPSAYFTSWIDWLAKLRFNRIQLHVCNWESMADVLWPEIQKRDLDLDLGIHGLNFFLPEQTYAADHPDWYADVDNRFGRQIRFSNLESIETLTSNILAFLDRHPGVAYLGLWPLDGTSFHTADIATGQMSDIVLTYINEVVAGISSAYPKLRYDHLAYVGYAAPPEKTRPRPQVTTSVCHYWSRNFTRPIYDAWYGRRRIADQPALEEAVRKFHPLRHHRDCCEQLAGWLELGRTLVFCYYADLNLSTQNIFNLAPVIQADLRYYRALGVDGLLNCYCFHEETLWLYRDLHAFADLMWDADLDWSQRQVSLLSAMFGDAATAMAGFYESLNELHNEPLYCGCCLADLFRGLGPAYELSGYLPQLHEAVLQQVESRFQTTFGHLDAAAAATDAASAERIAGIRLNVVQQLAFARLGCHVLLGFHFGDAGALDKGLAALDEALSIFNAWVADYERERPPWANLTRKIRAYRVALETDFPDRIRRQCAATT